MYGSGDIAAVHTCLVGMTSIDLQEDRFGFEPEITAKLIKRGIRIKEVPISYYPRTNEEGKKIGFKDGLRAIWCIWKYR